MIYTNDRIKKNTNISYSRKYEYLTTFFISFILFILNDMFILVNNLEKYTFQYKKYSLK